MKEDLPQQTDLVLVSTRLGRSDGGVCRDRWSYRRAAWCALSSSGAVVGEGAVPADEDGLVRLLIERGTEVRGVVEMMSGAIWVRDQLACAGWRVQIAHARKVRDAREELGGGSDERLLIVVAAIELAADLDDSGAVERLHL